MDPIERLFRSRHLRLGVGALLLLLVWNAGGSRLVAPLLGELDPILIQSAGFKLVFGWAAVFLLWNTLAGLDNGLHLRFRQDVWPALKAGNLAVAIYFGARVLAVALLIGAALG